MGVFIMLNNFFHDFAVGLLFASLLVLSVLFHSIREDKGSSARLDVALEISQTFNRVIIGCWGVILIGGVIRILAYKQYEWMEAAGRGQVTALILKHLLLVALILWGTVLQFRLRKHLRKPAA